MTIRVGLQSPELGAEAGGSASCDLEVTNDGPEAVEVALAVTGTCRPYSWIAPDKLAVPPGGAAKARVGFHLPRSPTPAAGLIPFAVTAAVAGAVGPVGTADGTLEVRPFSVLSANLSQPDDDGSGGSRHVLTLGNRGNAPAVTALRAEVDDAEALVVTIEPATVSIEPAGSATATVSVRPTGGGQRPGGGDSTYRVIAEPDHGDPVKIFGRFQFTATRERRKVGKATWITVGVVVALIVAIVALVSASGGDEKAAGDDTPDQVAVETPIASDCPARDHTDPHGITGLQPDDIPNLPASYSFFAVAEDQCTQVRFNPCEPIHFVINATEAPPSGVDDVRTAFARLGRATGITFVDDGLTDETTRSRPYAPDRYPERWAPILVIWGDLGQRDGSGTTQIVGRGAGLRSGDVYVSGILRLNKDAVINQELRTPVPGGFGPEIGSGSGTIGAEGVTWGRIILHELGHVIGLGHVRDPGQIMYPETAVQTFRPSDYRPGDREGLALLGRDAGCLETPALPTA